MSRRAKTGASRRWGIPALFALALHVVVGFVLLRVGTITAPAQAGVQPEVIDIVFAEPAPEAPTRFTELPEDRMDEAADDPRFLSNVDSRARDEAEGGAEETPRLTGLGEVTAVPIPDGDPSATNPTDSDPAEEETPQRPDAASASEDAQLLVEADAIPRDTRPPEIGERPESPSSASRRWGDLPQMALNDPRANAPLTGNVSLSTTDWEYGDWMKAFRRDFLPNWRAPSGYLWMLIHGRTRLEAHIAPGGELIRLEIVGQEGHQALHDASVRAFDRSAPFPPLPDDFPDEELVLRIELIYPKVWR